MKMAKTLRLTKNDEKTRYTTFIVYLLTVLSKLNMPEEVILLFAIFSITRTVLSGCAANI